MLLIKGGGPGAKRIRGPTCLLTQQLRSFCGSSGAAAYQQPSHNPRNLSLPSAAVSRKCSWLRPTRSPAQRVLRERWRCSPPPLVSVQSRDADRLLLSADQVELLQENVTQLLHQTASCFSLKGAAESQRMAAESLMEACKSSQMFLQKQL